MKEGGGEKKGIGRTRRRRSRTRTRTRTRRRKRADRSVGKAPEFISRDFGIELSAGDLVAESVRSDQPFLYIYMYMYLHSFWLSTLAITLNFIMRN